MHFTTLIIKQKETKIEDILMRYDEENSENSLYGEFVCEEERAKKEYATKSTCMYRLPDGTYLTPGSKELFRSISKEEYDNLGFIANRYFSSGRGETFYGVFDPENVNAVKEDVPYIKLYPDWEAFIEDFYGYQKDERTNQYGYWTNPDSKFDYYDIMAVFSGESATKAQILEYVAIWEKEHSYENFVREWDIVINNAKLAEDENEKDYVGILSYMKKDTAISKFHDAETYAKSQIAFYTYAVIDVNNQWIDMSQKETNDVDWTINFVNRFIVNAPEDAEFVLADMHI